MRGGDLAIRQARDTFAAQGRSHTQGNVADKTIWHNDGHNNGHNEMG